ncbi:PAS domain-containing protein [Pedobacter sp. MR2016-24]|uniref:sensor histidine kinase n=1 Tax=Pedobacter sp. MR2016-24 TaxID=2994466 RepID=UPI0022472A56|nr:ATP-binding protein [Pedobacter sp. MR2016-24]MCX2485025.1 PAS domain-containing protein [Pedobacter sp. MR2016-24]
MENKTQQISALIELNDELENYFRNTIIPQLFVDANMVLRKFTPPAMKQFNLRLDDVGRSIEDIRDNFRFHSIMENIQQVITTGDILEKEIQTTDLRWFQMNILPYIIEKGSRTNGVIITFVDITSRIRDLKEQEKLISEHELLLDTISHDIKTPLTSLGLTIEMLKKIPEKGMARFPVLLEKVENSLLKMKDIIHDLTDSRQFNNRYKAVEELLNFEHILEDVRLTLAPQILESGTVIKSKINQSEIIFVRRKLRSILYNLINNAIKYRDINRPLKILIDVSQEEDFTVITVVDNGRGIAEQDFEKIFTKYERIALDVDGSGIGLYLIREIIKLAGGKITVESELGNGSNFKVYIKNGG